MRLGTGRETPALPISSEPGSHRLVTAAARPGSESCTRRGEYGDFRGFARREPPDGTPRARLPPISMRRIIGHVLQLHLGPFFLGFSVVTFLLTTDFLLEYLDLLINKGVPAVAV